MAQPIEDLIAAGALTYALSQLTRDRPYAAIRTALRQRYLSASEADIDYILELAADEIAARSRLYSQPDNVPLTLSDIPFIPGTAPGMLEFDLRYESPGREGRAGRAGYVRMQMDDIDRTAAFLLGMPAPGRVAALRLSQILATVRDVGPSDIRTIAYRLGYRGEAARDIVRQWESRGGHDVLPTRSEIEGFAAQLPTDEPERIILPPQWRISPLALAMQIREIIFLGRG